MVLIKVFVLYKEGEGFLSATNIGAPYYELEGWVVLGKMWEDVYFDFKASTYGWVMDKDADHSNEAARHMFNMYLKEDRKKA